jgi:large subunit ribosomal protein L16
MKQYPSRLKYKKNQKPSASLLYLVDNKTFLPIKGNFLIKSTENASLTYNQLEACRRAIKRKIRRQGTILIRLFTNISRTKKPLATRMGKGKGSHSYWLCQVKSGQVICEVLCKNSMLAFLAVKEAAKKLPVKVYITSQFY